MKARLAARLTLFVSLILLPPEGHTAPPQAVEEESLPVPPLPPDHPPTDTAAPVPNVDLSAPVAQAQDGPTLKPTLNEGARQLPGGDPVPGTLYRSDQEQRRQFIPNPGIRLIVPFQK